MARMMREAARESKKKATYPAVIIVCEGAKTEPIYFNNFKNRNKPLRIKVVDSAAGKSYDALIQAAVDAEEKHIKGTEGEHTVWCVSGVDMHCWIIKYRR